MNKILHYQLTIDLDVWEPKKKRAVDEIDDFVLRLKKGDLLGSAGNVKTVIRETENAHS